VSLASVSPSFDDLEVVGRAIGDRSIVLLGENGHGCSQFTAWKVQVVRYLHERLGFEVVAFESGFYDCLQAQERAAQDPPVRTLQRCLIVQLHHAEVLPLFEYLIDARQSARPLSIAGIDFQIQSFATRARARWYQRELRAVGFPKADTLAVLDSIIIEKSFQPVDTLRSWLRLHVRELKTLYGSAAAATEGDVQWSLEGASEHMRREMLRFDALAMNEEVPTSVFEVRDQWMARSIERAAGVRAGRPRKKVVVWLHNDHARYGEWEVGALRVRSAGRFLRERFPEDVFSIGLLMGGGSFADNFRRPRPVAPPDTLGLESVFAQAGFPISWLALRGSPNQQVSRWANAWHTYSRGDVRMRIRPAREFDALVYFDSVSPPAYTVR
jgi:erythromycin esterase